MFGGWLKVFVYNNTASVMAYAASEANPEEEIIFFDKHSHIIVSVKSNTSRAPFLGGGTVNWGKGLKTSSLLKPQFEYIAMRNGEYSPFSLL